MASRNLMGRARGVEDPYLVFRDGSGTWEWRVLKSWQADNAKPYGRWLCQVVTPMTGHRGDIGDVYVYEVVRNGRLVDYDHDIEGLLEQATSGMRAPRPVF